MLGSRNPCGRRGSATVLMVIAMLVMLMVFAFAVEAAWLSDARTGMANAVDAAGLAATGALADDDLLLGDPSVMVALAGQARAVAVDYAAKNPVLGQPLALDPNPSNAPRGDVVLGIVDRPSSRLFTPVDFSDSTNSQLLMINAMRITGRRTRARGNPAPFLFGKLMGTASANVIVSATAMLDRDVIGFRPPPGGSIPLVPIALLSDPTGQNPATWEFQVAQRGGTDVWRFDRPTRTFLPGSDGLFEMQVTLGSNGCLLQLGVPTAADAATQVTGGVTALQLADLGGELVLGPDNSLTVPGFPNCGPPPASADLDTLRDALTALNQTGELRAWPLYVGTDGTGVVLDGFVAARVANVTPVGADGTLSFTLQAGVMVVSTAVTDASRRDAGAPGLPNPYLAQLRLVE
jgi:Flp pilus assembly protein TadG